MNTVLWMISFALHITTIYILVVLFTRYRSLKELEDSQKNIQKETEEALSYFLMEIKEENEKFLAQFNQKEFFSAKGQKILEEKNIPPKIDVNRKNEVPKHLESLLQSQEDVLDVEAKDKDDYNESEFDLRTKTFKLLNDGYSPEEIAQKLNIGKTEVELFIKFNENE